jgi:hypothetical protein
MQEQNPAHVDAAGLRAQAEQRLRDAASTGTSTALDPRVMAALQRLSLVPEQAAAALLLEQELRLHQIEIEVLREQLQQAGAETARDDPASTR